MTRAKFTLAAEILIAAGSISGCYTSPHALSVPENSSTNAGFTGVWLAADDEQGDEVTAHDPEFAAFAVMDFDGQAYLVMYCCMEGSSYYYRAFSTVIAEKMFFSLQEVGASKGGNPFPPESYPDVDAAPSDGRHFFFARVEMNERSDSLAIRIVDEELFESQTIRGSADLIRIIEAHLEDDALYTGPAGIFRRAPETRR